ncbi:hypothetical protein JT06_14830 [Desulfobulbus sp. Tol-SR]|nr:hypothetical protein JT06_14830 [Desulfobulbus sp. Tol-SR]
MQRLDATEKPLSMTLQYFVSECELIKKESWMLIFKPHKMWLLPAVALPRTCSLTAIIFPMQHFWLLWKAIILRLQCYIKH